MHNQAAARNQSTPPPTATGRMADIIQPYVDRQAVAGVVTLVASPDGVLDLETFGVADLASRRPMAADTLFWVASQTKPFTGTLMAMLVEEGKVHFEDPVEKYLPEFKGQMVIAEQDDSHRLLRPPIHPITVHNILTHTAGLAFSSPVETPSLDLLPLRTAVHSYAMLPLLHEPDSRYEYSNEGINTAGRIIEVVSHQPYEDFLRTRLLEPLGLRDTTFWPDAAQTQRLAKSYKPHEPEGSLEETPITQLAYGDLTDRVRRFAMPAGGLFSTAEDCGRFCRMIARGGELDGKRYLSEASVRVMTSQQVPASAGGEYGYGWQASGGKFGHGGAQSTSMFIDRQTGLVMILLVQHVGGNEVGKMSDAFQHAAVERFGPGKTP